MAELFKLPFPPWHRDTCLKLGHAVLVASAQPQMCGTFGKSSVEQKGKDSLGAVTLSHSTHVLSAMIGRGGKLWEFLKTKKFPTNVFTERDEIGFKNNDLKIMKGEGTGSHQDCCGKFLGTCWRELLWHSNPTGPSATQRSVALFNLKELLAAATGSSTARGPD